jgi:hypothetical protein
VYILYLCHLSLPCCSTSWVAVDCISIRINRIDSATGTTSCDSMNGTESLVEVLQMPFAASNGCFAPFSPADSTNPASEAPKEKDVEGYRVSLEFPLRRTSTWSFLREQWTLATQELVRNHDHDTSTVHVHNDDSRQTVLDRWSDRLWTLHTSIPCKALSL